jgi:hypothetical protein
MTMARYAGSRHSRLRPPPRSIARRGVLATVLSIGLAGCATPPYEQPVIDPGISGELTDMQIRIQMLQAELNVLQDSLRNRGAREAASSEALETQLAALQAKLDALPETLVSLCPDVPESATVMTQCEGLGEVQRVVVSGDKLVVGELERVWIDPPDTAVIARIDPTSETSTLAAEDIVEFERDGNRWVRFNLPTDAEPLTAERPIKRTARVSLTEGGTARRPVVDLRVQLGDVRENVEFALGDRFGDEYAMVLGRNFLTDVALIDIGERFIQPAIRPRAN